MILDRMARRVTNSACLTLDSPLGWDTGGSLYDGKTLGAMKLPAVNACIEIISDSVAKMPIYLMDSATRERQTDHPALRLLTGRPTEALTAFDYHKLMESRRITHGNAYALILRDRWGAPAELLPIAPGYMQPFLDDNGRLWYIGTNPRTGEFRKFWPADVLHYKAFSVDGLEGVSYLSSAGVRRDVSPAQHDLIVQAMTLQMYDARGADTPQQALETVPPLVRQMFNQLKIRCNYGGAADGAGG